MMTDLERAFAAIGAEVVIERSDWAFELDVLREEGREQFVLRFPEYGAVHVEAMDVHTKRQHLVIDVMNLGRANSARYLCGHDEFHWFAAAVPFHTRTMTVKGAMEMLKPDIVQREQKRKGVNHRRYRRKTAAYVRQGEWFFLPRPKMHAPDALVQRNAELVRNGGKPHVVERLYQSADGKFTFAHGNVSHEDHATLALEVWHRVVRNTEPEPPPKEAAIQMMYLD